MAAVFLFILTCLNFSESPVKGKTGIVSKSEVATEEKKDNFIKEGIMGGPADFELTAIPAVLAAYDFTSDDAQENYDFMLMDGNSLVSQDSPVPLGANPFGSMRKEVIMYVVEEGDTPSHIAVKFNINTNTILWANNLRDGDYIRPGDKLIIMPINGVRIKVGANETLNVLAKKYGGKEKEIIAFNELPESGTIIAGKYLIIPNGEMPSVAPRPAVTAPRFVSNATPVSNWLIAPTTGKNWGRIHANNGVDISNVCGTPIYAAAAGTVILSDGVGWNGGYGKYIKIRHANGVVTLYAHFSQMLVNIGQAVSQGQLIGLMGTTGRSTGCHLHFEVHGAKNPMAR